MVNSRFQHPAETENWIQKTIEMNERVGFNLASNCHGVASFKTMFRTCFSS